MGRLDRLELENFKSYERQRIIGPFKDFTCIIGPNGAGKSNVMDAISFVLGVTSRYLRSQNLAELVHRSENRKKSIQRATVRAIYIKDDGTQVVLSRSVLASTGTSEYRIDNSIVSYAEYSKFLEQENILTKAHNFLVFQGDVEALSQKNPMELTKLIEQVSGSDELKDEYEEKKLIFEQAESQHVLLQAQRKELAEENKLITQQRNDSAKFDRLDQRKKDLEIERQTWRIWYLEQKIKEKEKIVAQKKEELTKLLDSGSSDEANKQIKKQQTAAQKELVNAEKKLQQAQAKFSELMPIAVQAEEQVKHFRNRIDNSNDSITRIQQDVTRNMNELGAIRKSTTELQQVTDRFEKESKGKLQLAQISASLMKEYDSLQLTVHERTAKERIKLESLEHKHAPDLLAKKQNESRKQELQTLEKHLLDQVATHSEPHQNLLKSCRNIQKELDQIISELNGIANEKTRLSQTKQEASDALKSSLEKLGQAKADHNESERELKQRAAIEGLKRLFPGVHGRLIDLIRPSNKNYELALTLTLGKNLDAIIVDQERVALSCIKHLRDQRMAPMTFIPLDTIHAKKIEEGSHLRNLNGARLAIDIIKYDSIYSKAIQYACGNALICDSLNIAKEICYEQNIKVKAITLNGTIIHKSGMMTGGNSQSINPRRWEERELSIIKSDRDRALSLLTDLNKALKKLDEEEREKNAKKSELQARLQYVTQEENVFSQKLQDLNEHLNSIKQEKEELEIQFRELIKKWEKFEKEFLVLQDSIHHVQDSVFSDFCQKIGYKNIREFESNRLVLEQEINATRVQYASAMLKLRNQESFLDQKVTSLQEKLENIKEQKKNDTESLQMAEEKTKQIKEKFLAGQENINKAKSSLQEANQSFNNVMKNLKEARRELRKEHAAVDNLQRQVSIAECDVENYLSLRVDILKKCKLAEVPIPLSRGFKLNANTDVEKVAINFDSLSAHLKAETNEALATAHFNEQIKELQLELDRLSTILIPIERLKAIEIRHAEAQEQLFKAQRQHKQARDQFNDVKARRLSLFQPALNHIVSAINPLYKDLTRNDRFPDGGIASLILDIDRNGDGNSKGTIINTSNKNTVITVGGSSTINQNQNQNQNINKQIDNSESFNFGILYHAMPPGKKHLDMDQLSGGERTVASLALLFAIHSYRPAPFFILDEIDAALDNPNVQRVVKFLKNRANGAMVPLSSSSTTTTITSNNSGHITNGAANAFNDNNTAMMINKEGEGTMMKMSEKSLYPLKTQIIVISLKTSLYENAAALVGIYRDPDECSSAILTLNLEDYPNDPIAMGNGNNRR